MLTLISYIGLLIGGLIMASVFYVAVVKIQLI
uniref:Cytochrome b6-f complex subunit 6 n=2 Tax=Ulva TaxID=3118 RepID=A0A8F0LBV5_9CHLO|nr:cytochrome b6-f complex subunit 6 [Ulva rigida]QOK35615.1 cytochrome b6-f complex subunit 6 [Ulva rigida]QWL15245.1 cytochrome b6-f complex subunit 6 [Ulva rigida]